MDQNNQTDCKNKDSGIAIMVNLYRISKYDETANGPQLEVSCDTSAVLQVTVWRNAQAWYHNWGKYGFAYSNSPLPHSDKSMIRIRPYPNIILILTSFPLWQVSMRNHKATIFIVIRLSIWFSFIFSLLANGNSNKQCLGFRLQITVTFVNAFDSRFCLQFESQFVKWIGPLMATIFLLILWLYQFFC